MKKLTVFFIIGVLFVFSAPLVWGQGTALTPEGFNAMLESYKLKLAEPQKCPCDYVAVSGGKTIFGATAMAYSPADYNAIFEAYGLKLVDAKKCPPEFVTAVEGKYVFGTTPIAYDDYKGLLEAYGVRASK
jgi:hypothetical protein